MTKPSDVGNTVTTTGNPNVYFYTGHGDSYAYLHVADTDIWIRIEDINAFGQSVLEIAQQMPPYSYSSRSWDVIA